jgi:4-amino-4-deoxy-L-arabinose transferase-like glycosyltransferase
VKLSPSNPDSLQGAEPSDAASIWWLAAILGAAGGSYALVAAAHPVFGRAEVYFAESARAMIASHRYVTPRYLGQPFFDKPILSYWAIVASFQAFGVTHFAARLPSLLAALATAALTGTATARLAGKRAGLAAAAVLSSSYLFGYFATLSMSDMWLTLFVSAACVLLFAGSVQASRRTAAWWLASVCLGLAFLSKGPVGVILPVGSFLSYLALARELKQIRLQHLLTAVATVGVLAGVWFFALWRENGTHALYAFFIEENLLRFRGQTYSTDRSFGYMPLSFVVGGLPWTLLLPAVGWEFWRKRREWRTSVEGRGQMMLWCHAAVVISFFWLSRMQLDYYILPALPAFAAMAGMYLARPAARHELLARIGGWALAVTLILLGAAAGVYLWPKPGGESLWSGEMLAVWVLACGLAMAALLACGRHAPAYAMVFLAICGGSALGAEAGSPAYRRYVPVADYTRAARQNGAATTLALSSDLDLWRAEFAFQAGQVPQRVDTPKELADFLGGSGPRMAVVPESWTPGLAGELSGRVRVVDRRPGLAKGVTLATLLDSAKLQGSLAPVALVSNDGDDGAGVVEKPTP